MSAEHLREPSILQSPPWADFQRALGKKVFTGSGDGFSFLAIQEKTPLGSFLYVPFGPAAASPDGLRRSLDALAALAAAKHAHYVRVEPVGTDLGPDPASALKALGLVKAPTDVQPKLTWLVDLSQDEKAILGGMRSTSRGLYRNISKKGVTFDISTDPADISVLLAFLHTVSERAAFRAQSDDYLAQAAQHLMPAGSAKLFIARLDGEPIAAALSYDTGTTRVYAHAAADAAHGSLNAGTPLVVTMMMDAKASGRTSFDLWGVSAADQPEHPWAGFSRFKRSFGGFEVEYPGSWDLPVNAPMYRAYSMARRLRDAAVPAVRYARTKTAAAPRGITRIVRYARTKTAAAPRGITRIVRYARTKAAAAPRGITRTPR